MPISNKSTVALVREKVRIGKGHINNEVVCPLEALAISRGMGALFPEERLKVGLDRQ